MANLEEKLKKTVETMAGNGSCDSIEACNSHSSENSTHVKVKDRTPVANGKPRLQNLDIVVTFWKPWTRWIFLTITTICSLIMHLYNIHKPNHVCWDETHFGKMASWYINRTFFFDVHPPVGKMLIMAAGLLSGYNGTFPFTQPGDHYGDETQYVGMRIVCALFGSALVPLAYSIVWELTKSVPSCLFTAVLILSDTGTLTLTRYILLDPFLLFYIMAASFCIVKFINEKHRPFHVCWWCWLLLTGINLAFAIGIKFVGLFMILLAGFTTVKDLWQMWGNLSLPISCILKHFAARAVCLILLPSILYAGFFAIHFKILNKSGSGDGFFSSAFQSQLIGNKLHNAKMPNIVAYGSHVTMKQSRIGGGYLHSHWHLYPKELGPRQQQITTYSHKDDNNVWIVKHYDTNPQEEDDVKLVRNGDLVRLEHVVTQRNLHSHYEMAPLTRTHYQISGYGENGTGDVNDIFRIEISGGRHGDVLKSVTSQFKLLHMNVGCALHSHNKQLPKWGWEQLEVTCNPLVWQANNLWHIEEITDYRLPDVSFEVHAPSFWDKFVESHAVMRQGNQGLKPKDGEVTSRPWQWPLNYRGQPFSGEEYRIYLLGNPVIWWCVLILMTCLGLDYSYHAVKTQRGRKDTYPFHEYKQRSYGACGWLTLGWAIHYLPFWTMTRVLYYHHYFPAFLFSCMIAGITIDFFLTRIMLRISRRLQWSLMHIITASILAALIYSFFLFHPLTYGMTGNMSYKNGTMGHLRWLETWDF
ncbi:protein O-mannosyl-transferase 2-like [Tubulanus polymorphus]|uniref:protein O-mannosyl-transferase 2-like n=1 Tax=Tubulanus polymorphus TaxID=672921 RepID=UPI003DA1D63B